MDQWEDGEDSGMANYADKSELIIYDIKVPVKAVELRYLTIALQITLVPRSLRRKGGNYREKGVK